MYRVITAVIYILNLNVGCRLCIIMSFVNDVLNDMSVFTRKNKIYRIPYLAQGKLKTKKLRGPCHDNDLVT